MAHGCQAGLQQEAHDDVWFNRIRKGNDYYSTKKLGALGSDLGAAACFFDQPWTRCSSSLKESDQAVMLNFAAFALRALGRLTEALEPMRAGLEMRIKQAVWNSAAIIASNLSQLEQTLGEVSQAERNAAQSVTYADRSGDAFQRESKRTTHADALHQAGRRTEAFARFREAEQMQAERQPAYPLLYSLRGFNYCDLLLTEAERACWNAEFGVRNVRNAELIDACRDVSQRAAQALKIAEDSGLSLLTIALDHLTLGRASFYAAILSRSEISNSASEIEEAVKVLRRAGQQDELPKALLTRAWQRFLTGQRVGPDSAQSDLDEAWEIAERGAMRLFLADIHLTRCRLFGIQRSEDGGQTSAFSAEDYPWESPQRDLEEAERLINECGYHRRDEELADARKAILSTTHRAAEPATAPAMNQKTNSFPIVVLITVNDNETDAVFDAFLDPGTTAGTETRGGVDYSRLGVHGGHEIIHTICEMGAGGLGASQQRTAQAIAHWQPRAVIAVGIAFGLDESKQKIGDVLISKQLQDYELGRLNADGSVTPRGDKVPCADALLSRLRTSDTHQRRQSPDWPKNRFGLVLSGQKLVDNLDYRESLKQLAGGEAIGGEMEGGGLYVSAQAAKVDWVVIKAICDWGHHKNQADKDAWQKQAAGNAARVVKAALDAGCIYEAAEAKAIPAALRDAGSKPAMTEEELQRQLTDLPGAWFEQLVFKFDRNNAVPGEASSQAKRALELIRILRVVDPEFVEVSAVLRRLKGDSA